MENVVQSINQLFSEHRVSRGNGSVYARYYRGAEPALVLMHGFPDNLRIWDDLVPYLIAQGRAVVTFDFLGFGASDKPADAAYSFAQQLGDLEAVADQLDLKTIVPVAHDSSGMAALNYALRHPDRVQSVVMLNSAYSDDALLLWPELITLFAAPALQTLAHALAQDAGQMDWLLTWQQQQFAKSLPPGQREHFKAFIGTLIRENFVAQPGSGPAFVQLTAQFFEELRRNASNLPCLKRLGIPVKIIWGRHDPYLTVAVAERRRDQLKSATLTVIEAGHWLQTDAPAKVAEEMLS